MAKANQAVQAQATEKRKGNRVPGFTLRLAGSQVGLPDNMSLAGIISSGHLADQAAQLGGPLQHALARQVGQAQGNRYLQRLLTAPEQEAAMAPGRFAGPAQALQRFGGEEHRSLGAAVTGGGTLDIDLGDGTKLTFGEMVALGDYFRSDEEIRKLAQTPAGQAKLRWARWDALKDRPEPAVSQDVKKAVKDEYYLRAAENLAHFSMGGSAVSAYAYLHEDALRLAFFAGASENPGQRAEAQAKEAFAQHFLSDMFAAGHIRTPRMQIKAWYQKNHSDSVERFVRYAADQITGYLFEAGGVPLYAKYLDLKATLNRKVEERIKQLGGPAVESYSLGDVVSLAYHNLDNAQLGVVSEVDPWGNVVPGGFRWTAKGDSLLAESPITQQMAVAAMRASLDDLEYMQRLGRETGGGKCMPREQLEAALRAAIGQLGTPCYAAERYTPREDTQAGNPQMSWEWGQLDPVLRDAVDRVVRRDIASGLRTLAGGVDEFKCFTVKGEEDPKGPVKLYMRYAFLRFCDKLATDGILALQRAMDSVPSPVEEVYPANPGVPIDAGVPEAVAE